MTEIHFGTDGWRAEMADTFTVRNVQIAAQAIANYVKRHSQSLPGLIVGYDTRFFSENFAQKVASVLLGNGLPLQSSERETHKPSSCAGRSGSCFRRRPSAAQFCCVRASSPFQSLLEESPTACATATSPAFSPKQSTFQS